MIRGLPLLILVVVWLVVMVAWALTFSRLGNPGAWWELELTILIVAATMVVDYLLKGINITRTVLVSALVGTIGYALSRMAVVYLGVSELFPQLVSTITTGVIIALIGEAIRQEVRSTQVKTRVVEVRAPKLRRSKLPKPKVEIVP